MLGQLLNNIDKNTQRHRNIIYVGRQASASPATGALKVHNKEQDSIIDQALNRKKNEIPQPYMPRN